MHFTLNQTGVLFWSPGSRFHYLLTCKPVDVTNFAVFAKVLITGHILVNHFWCHFTLFERCGTRKDIKKTSMVFFPVFPVLSYQKIKIFISYPLLKLEVVSPKVYTELFPPEMTWLILSPPPPQYFIYWVPTWESTLYNASSNSFSFFKGYFSLYDFHAWDACKGQNSKGMVTNTGNTGHLLRVQRRRHFW